jgi:hypothetical protein
VISLSLFPLALSLSLYLCVALALSLPFSLSQVLDSMKAGVFSTAGDEDTWGSDVLKIFAIGLAFKVVSPVPLPMHPEAGLS